MATDDKTLREKLLAVLQDDDDEPRSRRRDDDEETKVVLRGKDALRFLGLGDDEKPESDKPGDEEKPKDDPPKRGKGYFTDPDAK